LLPNGWRTCRLADVCSKVTDGTHNTPTPTPTGVPYITAVHVKDGSIDFENCYYVDEATHHEIFQRCDPRRGDVLMVNIGAGTATTAVVNVDFEFSLKNVALLKPDARYVSGEFLHLYQQFVRPHLVERLLSGGAQPFLSLGAIGRLQIILPPVAEQGKIAAALGACDGGVEVLGRVIEARQRWKRGLMQQLLTGKTRFKEFRGQRWCTCRLGELLKEEDRYVAFDDEHTYKLASIRRRSEGLFFREALQGKAIKTKVMKTIRAGDFLLSKMQVVHGAWGLVTPEFDGMFVSDSYIALVPLDSKKLRVEFLNYLSQTRYLRHLAYLACHGVHIEKMTFNLEDFLEEKILIPPTVEEQMKIVGVLSACDQEIELLQKQLDLLQKQKRGLMQKLLTGEVRVKAESGK